MSLFLYHKLKVKEAMAKKVQGRGKAVHLCALRRLVGGEWPGERVTDRYRNAVYGKLDQA